MFHIFLQDNYRLWFGTYSGNAGDALSGGSSFEDQWSASHRGMQFTTSDKDHDQFLTGNCASENKGGWWFNRYGKELIPLGCTGCGWLYCWEDLPALQQLELALCTCNLAQPNLKCSHLQILKEKQFTSSIIAKQVNWIHLIQWVTTNAQGTMTWKEKSPVKIPESALCYTPVKKTTVAMVRWNVNKGHFPRVEHV